MKINEQDTFFEVGLLLTVTIFVLVAEYMAGDMEEYVRVQAKSVYLFGLIIIFRLVFIKFSIESYRKVMKVALGGGEMVFPKASFLNVLLDVYVIFLLFFWIDMDKVHFVSVPAMPVVYVVLVCFQLIRVLYDRRKNRLA